MWENNYPMGTVLGDARPGAPELARRGGTVAGVTTIELVRPGVPDVKAGMQEGGYPLYDRPLKVEAWYPARVDGANPPEQAEYHDLMGRFDQNNMKPFSYPGRACRDAEPDCANGPYPVVIISHGYPGSRFLLSHLAENLSSKGYVVLSIGHTDNTYEDFLPQGSLESALIHRSMDQRFLIDGLDGLNNTGVLKGMLDVDRVGLVGFSMGGFGALRTLGAKMGRLPYPGFDALAAALEEPDFHGHDRVKAAVLFAPASFFLDDEGYGDVTTPTLWFCGDADPMVFYPKVRGAWERCTRSDRYLLTFEAMGHNVANNPAPEAAMSESWDILHRWADPVWDTWRLNNISQHFVTAYFDMLLRGDETRAKYFDVGCARGRDAAPDAYWPGFLPETAAGLKLEFLKAE